MTIAILLIGIFFIWITLRIFEGILKLALVLIVIGLMAGGSFMTHSTPTLPSASSL